MKKNNIIFGILLLALVIFIYFRFFTFDQNRDRNVEDNNVTQFTISAGENKFNKEQTGYYDIYNESSEDITVILGAIEAVLEPGYQYKNFYIDDGEMIELKGKGQITFKPAEFKNCEENNNVIFNGIYYVGEDIKEGKYRIKANNIDDYTKISINISSKATMGSGVSNTFEINNDSEKVVDLKRKDSISIKSFIEEKETTKTLERGETIDVSVNRMTNNSIILEYID